MYEKEEDRPLIVYSHGGPHSFVAGGNMIKNDRIYYLLKGYKVFIPSFTGTLGKINYNSKLY